MALRLFFMHIFGWLLPVTIMFSVYSSPSRAVFGAFGENFAWDILRLLVVIIAASGAFLIWKFVIQGERNKFRLNPSQNQVAVKKFMKRFPTFYDTSEEEFAWVKPLEEHAPEIINEVMTYLESDAAKKEFRTAYENTLLSLSPTWTTLNMISYGSVSSNELPRTLDLVSQLPNVFNCNVSRVQPHSVLKSHAGESSSYIRCHMGIKIPAEAPVTAMHVGEETRSWKEGKVMAFCDGHWHGAVNGADSERLVLIFDVMPERLGWYTRQYCALMLALNATLYILPGRFNLDEPIWRPGIFLGYLGLATIGLPILSAFYLRFKYSDRARPAWSRRLREVGFGFYY